MTEMLQVNTERNISESLKEKMREQIEDTSTDMYFHIQTLMMIATRCNTVLELGVRSIQSTWGLLGGLSAESFGVAVIVNERQLGFASPKKLTSVDIEDPSIHGSDIQEVYTIAEENGINYEFIKGDTLTVEVDNNEYDAIFFDTDHTYEQLSAELKRFGPMAKTWMMFHDVARFGKVLIPAINEWLDENPEWLIVPNLSTNQCMGFLTLARMTKETWESQLNMKYTDLYNKML
jgi:hypothetical protein